MKKLIKVALLVIVVAFTSANAQAQIKIGYLNTDSVFSLMPEKLKADEFLKEYGEQLNKQIEALQTELRVKQTEYEANFNTWTDAVKEAKEKELIDIDKRVREKAVELQRDFQNKQNERYSPVIKKLNDAIQTVAKEGKFSYIFDTSVGEYILYKPAGDDIFNLVKVKLALK